MKEVYKQYPEIRKLKEYSDYCTQCFTSYKYLLNLNQSDNEYKDLMKEWEEHKE